MKLLRESTRLLSEAKLEADDLPLIARLERIEPPYEVKPPDEVEPRPPPPDPADTLDESSNRHETRHAPSGPNFAGTVTDRNDGTGGRPAGGSWASIANVTADDGVVATRTKPATAGGGRGGALALGADVLDALRLWTARAGPSVADPERLDRLTPRERDVYKVWKQHPDWSNAQVGREVLLPPHVVRRYKENIKRQLEDPDPTFPDRL